MFAVLGVTLFGNLCVRGDESLPVPPPREKEFFIDNLMVQIQ